MDTSGLRGVPEFVVLTEDGRGRCLIRTSQIASVAECGKNGCIIRLAGSHDDEVGVEDTFAEVCSKLGVEVE